MEKIDIKDGYLTDVRIDFVKSGVQRGVLALHVKLGDAEKYNLDNVTNLVVDMARKPWPVRRIVRFVGNVDFDVARTRDLMKAFRDYGFEVHVELTSSVAVPFDIVTWATLRTASSEVLHSFNEIVYSPSREDLESGKVKNFIYPRGTLILTALWFNVAAGAATFDDVVKFLRESKLNWQVEV